MREKDIETQRNEALAAEVQDVEHRVLDLCARIAKEDAEVLTAVLCAAVHLDRARQALALGAPTAAPGDRITQIETPPVPSGEDVAPKHRPRPARR